MLSEYQELLIEKYFRKEIQPDEMEAFNELCSFDTEFTETVESQKILQKGLELLALKKQMSAYVQEVNEEEKVVPLWRRTKFVGIAASVLLFMAVTSYAFKKYNVGAILFGSKPDEEVVARNREEQKAFRISPSMFPLQKVVLLSANDNEFSGSLGTTFRFGPASLLDNRGLVIYDTVTVDLVEVQDPAILRTISAETNLSGQKIKHLFYILPYYSKSEIGINSLSPPKLILPKNENGELFYGGNQRSNIRWQHAADQSPAIIKKPTRKMDNLKRFVEGRILLDSISRLYYPTEDFYKPHSGQGPEFSRVFVKEIQAFVKNYQADPRFKEKVLEARHQWQIYTEQHTLQINRAHQASSNVHFIYEPGWYALVEK